MYSEIQEAPVASRGAQKMGVEEEEGSFLSERFLGNRGASNQRELITFLLHWFHAQVRSVSSCGRPCTCCCLW